VSDHEDDFPSRTLHAPRSLELPPNAAREEPTSPDASPRLLTTMPPPAGAEYFDLAYKKLLEVHQQQMQRFDELHDPEGPIGRLHGHVDLVLNEVRGMRLDFGRVLDRIATLEARADATDRRLRALEGLGNATPTEPAPPG